MKLNHELMETDEYKELFKNAKKESSPDEYDYFIHLSCLSYFMDKLNIKSNDNIEDSNTKDEI